MTGMNRTPNRRFSSDKARGWKCRVIGVTTSYDASASLPVRADKAFVEGCTCLRAPELALYFFIN
jgi:hypothetical protein